MLERHLCGLWVCTVAPGSLCAHVLVTHEGHLGIVKLQQRCSDLVWWPFIDREIEALVMNCPACLMSGKNGHPALSPLFAWPSQPQQQLQLVLTYDLHSKWPEVSTTGSVTSCIHVDFMGGVHSLILLFIHSPTMLINL